MCRDKNEGGPASPNAIDTGKMGERPEPSFRCEIIGDVSQLSRIKIQLSIQESRCIITGRAVSDRLSLIHWSMRQLLFCVVLIC